VYQLQIYFVKGTIWFDVIHWECSLENNNLIRLQAAIIGVHMMTESTQDQLDNKSSTHHVGTIFLYVQSVKALPCLSLNTTRMT
jgi:nitrous oxidase accessory protein NosD